MTEFGQEENSHDTWDTRFAPGLHPAVGLDYKRLGSGGLHLQEFVTEGGKPKILRIEWGAVDDRETAVFEIEQFKLYSEYLRANGIAVAEAEYMVANDIKGTPCIYVTVDKIENAVSFGDILESGVTDGIVGAKLFDDLGVKLAGTLESLVVEGGSLSPEVYRFEQYIVDADNSSAGPILIDVSPEALWHISDPSVKTDSLNGNAFKRAMFCLTEDVLRLQKSYRGDDFASIDRIRGLVEKIKKSGLIDDEAINNLLAAIETGDASHLDFTENDDLI